MKLLPQVFQLMQSWQTCGLHLKHPDWSLFLRYSAAHNFVNFIQSLKLSALCWFKNQVVLPAIEIVQEFVNIIQSAYFSSLCWLPIKVIISSNCSISVHPTILSTPDIVWNSSGVVQPASLSTSFNPLICHHYADFQSRWLYPQTVQFQLIEKKNFNT